MSVRHGGPTRVLLCVAGGIAAYKAPELVRAFIARGCEVQCVTTLAAKAFVTELSLATVSKRPVRAAVVDAAEEGHVGHIELADWADVVVVAPATADVLARAAAGMADDLVTVVLLATRAPVVYAPAMNTNMWQHAATVANLATLAARGASFVGPDRGELACGWIGAGRMIDPPLLVDGVLQRLARDRDLAGLRLLVSAGPTRAYLDPVRFLTNASTGAMGFALAEAAAARGADVTLVAGPVQRATPPGVTRIDIDTAVALHREMDRSLREAPAQLVAMVAAVADVAPRVESAGKLDKPALLDRLGASPWVEGIDVLAQLCADHRAHALMLGFAAQTADDDADVDQVRNGLLAAARAKLAAKRAHAFFVNRVGVPDTGFATETNAGWLIREGLDDAADSGPPRAKLALAHWLLDELRGAWPRGSV